MKKLAQEGFLELPDGHRVFTRISDTKKDKWLFVTHGIGEHSGRYDFIFKHFSHLYNIFTYDLRGHGKSSGKRGYVEDFSIFHNDLKELLLYLKEKHALQKLDIFGHSMGALITAGFLQKYKTFFKDLGGEKVFLSSPPVRAADPLATALYLLPSAGLKSLVHIALPIAMSSKIPLEFLSHDPEVGKSYESDELVLKRYYLRLLLALLSSSKDVFARPLGLDNVTITIGGEDKIVNVKAIQKYINQVDSQVSFRLFEQGRHELHFEIDEIQSKYLSFLKETLSA